MSDIQKQIDRWKPLTLGSVKSKVAREFQLLIRLRYSCSRGLVQCCSCDALQNYKKMHGGHYISRTNSATLFDNRNVHPQCIRCNNFLGGNRDGYEQFMIDRNGQGIIEQLRAAASQPKQWTRLELAEMITEFRREIKRQLKRLDRAE